MVHKRRLVTGDRLLSMAVAPALLISTQKSVRHESREQGFIAHLCLSTISIAICICPSARRLPVAVCTSARSPCIPPTCIASIIGVWGGTLRQTMACISSECCIPWMQAMTHVPRYRLQCAGQASMTCLERTASHSGPCHTHACRRIRLCSYPCPFPCPGVSPCRCTYL